MHKLKQSRPLSVLLVTLVYIAAAIIGPRAYTALPHAPWLSLLLADMLATVFVFFFSVLLGNASVYDPYRSVQPPVILAAFAWGKDLTAPGALLLIAVFFRGIRLTANRAYTFKGLCGIQARDENASSHPRTSGKQEVRALLRRGSAPKASPPKPETKNRSEIFTKCTCFFLHTGI